MTITGNGFLGAVFLFMGVFCAASLYKITSEKHFERLVDRHDYVIVFVYERSKKSKDLISYESLSRTEEAFDRLSNKIDYTDAHIGFLKVNQKDFPTIVTDYALKELPAFILFKKSRLMGSEGKRAILYGYPTRVELTDFIDEWLGSDIDVIVQAEQAKRERENERASNSSVSIHYGIAPGWGYSYWDWPYYRPGYFGGFGYRGHGYHGHRGHHRRGHH